MVSCNWTTKTSTVSFLMPSEKQIINTEPGLRHCVLSKNDVMYVAKTFCEILGLLCEAA